MADNEQVITVRGTDGHLHEFVSVAGSKASFQKFKRDLIGIPNASEAVFYTETEVNAYNPELEGALDSTTPLTAEQAEAYNDAITGAEKEAGDTLSTAEANAYNATLDGAISTDSIKTPAVPTKVKDYVDRLGLTVVNGQLCQTYTAQAQEEE